MSARFYFANLCVDIARCVKALQNGDNDRYADSLRRAHKTLGFLRASQRPEAYEEALLLLRGLEYAKTSDIRRFGAQLDHFSESLGVV